MATSLSTRLSSSLSRLFPAFMLGSCLFMGYEIGRVEVEAHWQDGPGFPAPPTPLEATPAAHPAIKEHQPSSPEAGERPSREPSRQENLRREWQERRERRWFTPPENKIDHGLPRRGPRFRVA